VFLVKQLYYLYLKSISAEQEHLYTTTAPQLVILCQVRYGDKGAMV